MDPTSPGGEHAQPPVADLVAEPLDDDRLVGWDHPRRGLLLAQVGDQVLGGPPVQVVLGRQLRGLGAHRLAGEGADRLAELGRPANPVALPERDRSWYAGRGDHDHAIPRDLGDPPGGRPKQEGLAGSRLIDHLLVELANAPAVRQVDAVEPAVGDRARVRDGELPSAGPAPDRFGGAVPDQARPKLGEPIRRVPAIEHVEDVLELLA